MMATGLPARMRARGGDYAHLDGIAQKEGGAVLCAAVAEGGYAGVEVPAGVLGCLHGEHLIGQRRKLIAGSSVADAVEVDVGVH